jgi:hypothetical protein
MQRQRVTMTMALALVACTASSVSGVACAADAGDDPKSASGLDASPPIEGGVEAHFDTGGAYDTNLPPLDSPASPVDASLLDAPVLDAPADTGGGTGCAAGAAVIDMPMLGNSGNFGTTGAVCVEFKGTVTGWNASNVQGRMVVVTGATTQNPPISGSSLGNQPGMGPGADGYIYWNFTGGAGAVTFASTSIF